MFSLRQCGFSSGSLHVLWFPLKTCKLGVRLTCRYKWPVDVNVDDCSSVYVSPAMNW